MLSACSNHDEIKEDAEAALSKNLEDPWSLKTRAVRAMDRKTDEGAVTIVCGEFATKDAKGRYAGYKPFAYTDRTETGKGSEIYVAGGLNEEGEVIQLGRIHRLCEGEGTEG